LFKATAAFICRSRPLALCGATAATRKMGNDPCRPACCENGGDEGKAIDVLAQDEVVPAAVLGRQEVLPDNAMEPQPSETNPEVGNEPKPVLEPVKEEPAPAKEEQAPMPQESPRSGLSGEVITAPELPVEFLTADGKTVTLSFMRRPLGMNFANKLPTCVTKVTPQGHAQEIGVQEGWQIMKIGERTLKGDKELEDFTALVSFFKEQATPLSIDSAQVNPLPE